MLTKWLFLYQHYIQNLAYVFHWISPTFLSAIRSLIGSPIIVTIWNVVFANNCRKLGWIWMKMEMELRPKKTKSCTFPAKSRYGFRRKREKMGCRDVFLWREPRTTLVTFLRSISAKLSTNTGPGGVSRHMVSHSRKVSIKGSNFPKHRLLRVL